MSTYFEKQSLRYQKDYICLLSVGTGLSNVDISTNLVGRNKLWHTWTRRMIWDTVE
jgi:hypothetical protein